MKEVVLRIDDAAFEKFMGMVSLCPMVEVVSANQNNKAQQSTDYCVTTAIREMQNMHAFRYPRDYAFLMIAINEGAVKGLPFFYTPMDFLDYMKQSEIENLPGRSTIYETIEKVKGRYPDWTFTDAPKAREILRRKNLVKLFLSAFVKAQMG